jgi:hypothetical protein
MCDHVWIFEARTLSHAASPATMGMCCPEPAAVLFSGRRRDELIDKSAIDTGE